MLHKVWYVTLRVLLATAIAVIIMFLPPPERFPAWLDQVQQPIVVFVLVCYIGKLLYDTLFYDHYQS
jgi:fumarate reductase subunit C